MSSSNPFAFMARRVQAWSLNIHRRLHRDEASGKARLDALPWLGIELETLARSTEQDFLSIGEKLHDFHRNAEEISEMSASLARTMSGKEVADAIKGFREVIDRVELLENESRRNAETFENVLETLAHLDRHLGSFHETVRHLRVLCVSTRIESARFGQRDIGFNALADEVGKLASVIEEKTSHLLMRSGSLRLLIGMTLARVSELETRQHAQARVILDQTMSNLESLLRKHDLSSAEARQIGARYRAISESIGEIVSSIQFHDIARQRVEHVKTALDSISGLKNKMVDAAHDEAVEEERAFGNGGKDVRRGVRFRWNGNRSGSKRNSDDLRLAGNVCAIQAAQLQHAKDELVSAVEKILENLRKVASHIVKMMQETEKMTGTANETGHSFFTEVETGFSKVASALTQYTATNNELSSVADSMGGTLREMSAYTGDIEGIGAKMRLIALNAVIKASQIGHEGATLDVLAEAIHHLSVETCQRTESVGASLRSIVSASEMLSSGFTASEGGKAAEVTRLNDNLRDLLVGLQSVNRDIASLLTRVNEEAGVLSNAIKRAIDETVVHHRVEKAMNKAVSQLQEVVAFARSLSPPDEQGNSSEDLRTLEIAYTMQREREVHHSVVSTAGIGLGKAGASPSGLAQVTAARVEKLDDQSSDQETEADLGDNVELF